MTALEGVVLNLPEVDYFASPALSSTEARLLLESPAKYRWAKDNPPLIEPSTKFDVGSAVHTKVLGTGYDIVVLDFDDWRTAAARGARDEARLAGKIALLKKEIEPIDLMAEAVLAHTGARQLFSQPGDSEVSVFSTDTATGVDVRARFDFLPSGFSLGEPSRVAVDLKTCVDASEKGFTKSVSSYRYDIQRAWYLDALRTATGEAAELVFVAVEKTAPYLVAVHQLPQNWARMGARSARDARETFARCVESGVWPGYGDEVHLLTAPNWLVYEHEERYPDD